MQGKTLRWTKYMHHTVSLVTHKSWTIFNVGKFNWPVDFNLYWFTLFYSYASCLRKYLYSNQYSINHIIMYLFNTILIFNNPSTIGKI